MLFAKSIPLVLAFTLLQALKIQACNCGFVRDFEERKQFGKEIFVGVLKNVLAYPEFYAKGKSMVKVFTFEVLKSHKNSTIQGRFISIHDYLSSSCSGFLNGAKPGDTVLVYARRSEQNEIWGNTCNPFSILSKLISASEKNENLFPGFLKEEIDFLNDSSIWRFPKFASEFKHGAFYSKNDTIVLGENQKTRLKTEREKVNGFYLKLLIFSALANLFLLSQFLRKQKK